jgi:hypothetical protein
MRLHVRASAVEKQEAFEKEVSGASACREVDHPDQEDQENSLCQVRHL